MTISSIPPNTASAITPFNPLGKHTVGEEDKDTKNSSLKAVEESSQSVRTGIRQQGKTDVVEAIQEDQRQKQDQSNHGQRGRNYLAPVLEPTRLGGIVSEAV